MKSLQIASTLLAAGLLAASARASAGRQQDQPPAQATNDYSQALARAREVLTPDEWRSVEKEDDAVKRVRRFVEFASLRLDEARSQVSAGALDAAARALAQYQAIVAGAFYCIDPVTEGNKKKRRSSYKEFDIKTRPQLPVLERLAREFTGQNSSAAEAALTHARRLRAMALNRFSGSKIIKVPDSD